MLRRVSEMRGDDVVREAVCERERYDREPERPLLATRVTGAAPAGRSKYSERNERAEPREEPSFVFFDAEQQLGSQQRSRE